MMAYLPALTMVAASLFAFLPGCATAQTPPGIQTPSHNIFCLYETYEGLVAGQPPDLRCELAQISSVPPPPPRPCPFSWGLGFEVTQKSAAGERICISDTIKNPAYPVLPYGSEWSHGGFSCKSETSGLTCTNASGHGFMLSRVLQRLF